MSVAAESPVRADQSGAGVSLSGPRLAQVTTALVQLHRDIYGRGPTRAKAVDEDGVLTVVMAHVRTPVEDSLVRAGRPDLVAEVRTACEKGMRDRFVSAIETTTGCHVTTFDSDVNVDDAVVTYRFVLSHPSR